MKISRSAKFKPFLKYLFTFTLGVLVGGGVIFQFGFGVMARLIGTEAQVGYSAASSAMDAYWLTSILSHQHLNEPEEASERTEWLLDRKTIEATQWAKDTDDERITRMRNGALGIVKRYRRMYPSQTDLKAEVHEALATVPELAEPQEKRPEDKLSALGRLYQRHQDSSK